MHAFYACMYTCYCGCMLSSEVGNTWLKIGSPSKSVAKFG